VPAFLLPLTTIGTERTRLGWMPPPRLVEIRVAIALVLADGWLSTSSTTQAAARLLTLPTQVAVQQLPRLGIEIIDRPLTVTASPRAMPNRERSTQVGYI
jgi:hypothetical protein